MGRIWAAFRIFFRTLFDAETAAQVKPLLEGEALPSPQAAPEPKPIPKPAAAPKPLRSDALVLLEALQREARFVDFLKEPLDGYGDEQVGAVARNIHRDAGKLLDRLFGLQPVVSESEGASLEVPAGFDGGRYRLTGHLAGEPPYRGVLAHHGWQATRCDLPSWSGSDAAARVIAPAEVEVK